MTTIQPRRGKAYQALNMMKRHGLSERKQITFVGKSTSFRNDEKSSI